MAQIGWKECTRIGGGSVFVNFTKAKTMRRLTDPDAGEYTEINFSAEGLRENREFIDVKESPEVILGMRRE